MDRSLRVADVRDALSHRFPEVRAEEWDRGGLLVGDPEETVTGVTLALDPTLEALEATLASGDNVLVTHHPAFLTPPSTLRPGNDAAGLVFAAIDTGVALINAHTSLDRDPSAQRLLPELLGLLPIEPLERSAAAMSIVTVYVPSESRAQVAAAMEAAGAGRIGDYLGCSFSAAGTGRFTAPAQSAPFTGAAGETSETTEDRLEMVCPRPASARVVAAAAGAHPYEEPLISVSDVLISRNAARLGMVSETTVPVTLADLAALAGERLGVQARVWGEPSKLLRRVATATGSGGSLLPDALAADVDAFVAGEVRYHDALNASEAGCAIVELGHDASEWPLVGLLEECVRSIEGMRDEMVHPMKPSTGWWVSPKTQGAR